MTSLQQAYLERMHPSGYGRVSESATSVRLPVNPLPMEALNNLQAQSDQVMRRVTALESSMTEVTRRLDDWAEVTRGGIADLRSEIGAVKLEQRFAQTLRSGAAATPLVGSAAASPMGRGEDVAGEELKKRLEVYEKKLSAIHSEHMFDASSLKERLEAALRESDQHVSRADELQALLKEEQGRRALLFGRLEAIEASVQDLRSHQKDFASLPEATEQLLRAEMKKEVERLRMEVGGQPRCEELDRRMAEMQQQQQALRGRVEAAVRDVDRHGGMAEALQRRCDQLEGRFEHRAEGGSFEEGSYVREELRREITQLREELKQDQLTETVALRGRLEETMGDQHAHQVGLGNIQQEVQDERHRRREEMCVVRSRLEALEASQGSRAAASDEGPTRASVAQLAKELTAMREEHDQAISSLGSLTELVAKTTTAGIQRSEERIAADLTGKRRDFERSMIQHREQMEREAKAMMAEMKNLSPTLFAGGGVLDVNDDRLEVALRHIDNLARELRSEVMSQGAGNAAQLAQIEGNFNSDLKRLGGIVSDCVSQTKGMQLELSKMAMSKLELRLASVEAKMSAQEDLESTEASKSRSEVGSEMKWMAALSKAVATPQGRSSEGRPKQLRPGLKEKLHGIHNSIYQVLGVLEGEEESVSQEANSQGSLSVALPFRPEGTLEKQLQMERGLRETRLQPVNEHRSSHQRLVQEGCISPREDMPRWGERSPSPTRNGSMSMGALVSSATGPSRVVALHAFTAPPSQGVSRELSPSRAGADGRASAGSAAQCINRPSMGPQSPTAHSQSALRNAQMASGGALHNARPSLNVRPGQQGYSMQVPKAVNAPRPWFEGPKQQALVAQRGTACPRDRALRGQRRAL